ncbi:MAG: transglutaminase domain-containing protein [Bacteroidaceae bacterium]
MQIIKKILMRGVFCAGLLALFLSSCSSVDRQEREDALSFLYQYMPLPDSVDYPREYWERCVEATLQARHEMPWGMRVPEREWKHFVLPVRVNNENLDDARNVLFHELKDRVKGLSMYDAVLEVNHWCHEHVTYQPSDARTSAPLATMASAIGRCGEESTFCVAALRSVGIPARQVYTPRWAHTDDNHAWVEAWVDGKWRFLGACEPEPVLDFGWFNAPAGRSMLMHTRVFGHYDGPEQVVCQTACYTEINVTSNYTEVSTLVARVTDEGGNPVENASVSFRLYNYAELYPIATFPSNHEGCASLTCGRGDLVAWAAFDGKFGFCKASVGQQDTVLVVLDKDASYAGELDFDLIPPPERDNKPKITLSQQKANKVRLAHEDSIRNAYMAETFSQDSTDNMMIKARANHRVLADFLKSQPDAADCRRLLGTLSDKDLRDVTAEVLADHFDHVELKGDTLWLEYVASPRVSNEMLTPWRSVLGQVFVGKVASEIVRWVQDSICVDDARNPLRLCMSPVGVYRHRVTDSHSRDVFFVCAARSAGIPARINSVTGQVQWADANGVWNEVNFDGMVDEAPVQSLLRLTYTDTDVKENPAYYTHFTLSRITKGTPRLQEFEEGSATCSNTFQQGAQMQAGQYLMVSGTRLATGGVLAHLSFFGLPQGGLSTQALHLRRSKDRLSVISSFDCGLGFTTPKGRHRSILEVVGRGYFVLGLITSNHEPSEHVLRDMCDNNIYLCRWDRPYLLLFPSQEEYDRFRRKDYDELPDNVLFGIADPETVKAMQIEELTHGSTELPIFMMCDTFNRVVWYNQGYSINMSQQIMDVIMKLMGLM